MSFSCLLIFLGNAEGLLEMAHKYEVPSLTNDVAVRNTRHRKIELTLDTASGGRTASGD